MAESLFSPLWYRVAALRPQLRPEVHVQRQEVRGERWYLLVNSASARQCRVNQRAYELIGRLDGERSVEALWETLVECMRDDAPSQDEVIQTLEELERHELLAHGETADAKTLAHRREARQSKRVQSFVNPFALRVPLGDPSALLQRLERLPALLYNVRAFWVWAVLVVIGVALAVPQLAALSAHAAEHMMTPRLLVLAWLAFPLVKALHELAHALAVRRWGGEVHEAGFTLFVLVPAPYVDASAATVFPHRYQRVVVSAAGIMAELAIAAVALIVWTNVQPGLVRDLAFVTIIIASVSTVTFNANPLLRFDGYYVLTDALNLPNLEARSKAWWMAAATRLVAGSGASERVPCARGEGKWLVLYAPLSFLYRLLIAWVIVVWIGGQSAVLATLAALVLAFMLIVKPGAAAARRLRAAASAAERPWRRRFAVASGAAAAIIAVCAIPTPFYTVAAGVVWPPEDARVRAGTDGFIAQILARDGDWVARGDVLVVLEDPALVAERAKLAQRHEQLQAGRFAAFARSAEEVQKIEEDLLRVQSEIERVEQKIAALDVRAQIDGRLVMPRQQDLPGTYVQQGTTLAHVLDRSDVRVRAAVPEYDAALVQDKLKSVEVRLAGDSGVVPAALVRNVPAATFELPSVALGDRGGGPHPTDPADQEGARALEPIVLVDVQVPGRPLESIGMRAWVRFEHAAQPLAQRMLRHVRQLFLQHFNPAS